MPIEGVDTFSCLCIPDLERAVSGAADDDVVSHLGRPDASRVANQRPQTLQTQQEKGEWLISKSFRVVLFIYLYNKKSHIWDLSLCPSFCLEGKNRQVK